MKIVSTSASSLKKPPVRAAHENKGSSDVSLKAPKLKKPLVQKQEPNVVLDEKASYGIPVKPCNYYQAIGWIKGKVKRVNNASREGSSIKNPYEVIITFQEIEYTFGLFTTGKISYPFGKHVDQNLEQELWLYCYPGFHLTSSTLFFKLVHYRTSRPDRVVENIFVLRGIWQFIPQSRRPVFTICRNKRRFESERVRSQHLPLLWKQVTPYKFSRQSNSTKGNPLSKADTPCDRADLKQSRKFYQIEARFLPRMGVFGWQRNLANPSAPPKYVMNEKSKFTT